MGQGRGDGEIGGESGCVGWLVTFWGFSSSYSDSELVVVDSKVVFVGGRASSQNTGTWMTSTFRVAGS